MVVKAGQLLVGGGLFTGLSIYREIRVFPRAVGNTGKYREILGNTGKYREIGNQWAHKIYGWQTLWLGV